MMHPRRPQVLPAKAGATMRHALGQRYVITQTQLTWSCLPSAAHVRWLLGWCVGFLLFAAITFPAGIWFMFAGTMLEGLAIATMIGGWLLSVLGYVSYRLWRERAIPLVADAHQGTLSFGPAMLCPLDQIQEIAVRENRSGDEPSYSVVVAAKDGRTIELPSWYIALEFEEARLLCRSLGEFVEGTRGRGMT